MGIVPAYATVHRVHTVIDRRRRGLYRVQDRGESQAFCVTLEWDTRQGRVQVSIVASPGRLSGRAVDRVRWRGTNKRDSFTMIKSRNGVDPGRSN